MNAPIKIAVAENGSFALVATTNSGAIFTGGNVCVVGGTTSNQGFPIVGALAQNSTYGGDNGQTPVSGTDHHGDGFICEFSPSGSLLFSSYFGGTEREACLSVAYDNENQIYVSGYSGTSSQTWLLPSQNITGLFQQPNFNGLGDAFVATIGSNRQKRWGTYFGGGSTFEVVRRIAISDDDKVAICGQSAAITSFIPTFSGTIQDLTPNGGVDWYVAVFNSAAQLTWGTFEGSTQSDQRLGGAITFDPDNNLYFAANLFSTSGVNFIDPGGNAYFNNTNSGVSSSLGSFNNYAMIVNYRTSSYNPIWRSLLMDGTSQNRIYSLHFRNERLHISGATKDATMSLISSDPQLYSGSYTAGSSGVDFDGFAQIFDGGSKEILHSSYFGGNLDDFQLGFVPNQFSEIFGFGYTDSRYFNNDIGIPVKNNDISGSWYRDNYPFANTEAGFAYKYCLIGTPLSNADSRLLEANALKIFPNPSSAGSQTIRLELENKIQGQATLILTDVTGKVISTIQNLAVTEGFASFDSPILAPGIYILTIGLGTAAHSGKLIVVD